MAFYVLSLLVSVGLIVHCFKTGRNMIWVTVLIFLPFVGALAYFLVELLPDIRHSRAARRTVRGIQRSLDPARDSRRYQAEARVSNDVATGQRFADELVRLGRASDAVQVYRDAMTGLFAQDPKLMEGLARAQFAALDAAGTRATLDALIAANPDYKSADGHLLYARALRGVASTRRTARSGE